MNFFSGVCLLFVEIKALTPFLVVISSFLFSMITWRAISLRPAWRAFATFQTRKLLASVITNSSSSRFFSFTMPGKSEQVHSDVSEYYGKVRVLQRHLCACQKENCVTYCGEFFLLSVIIYRMHV